MTLEFSLNVDDIIRELNLGRATVNFILERFAGLLPHNRVQGRTCYSQETLSMLIRIKDLMDQGLLPSQIEEAIAASPPPERSETPPAGDVRMSQDALTFIQNLFQDIKVHQSRIAQAHEKRAVAEERKAVAIEKRAEAEARKAEAMNNIAAALQEMSRHRPVDTQTMEIAGQAAHALTMNETHQFEVASESDEPTIDLDAGIDDNDLNDLFSPPGSGYELRAEPDMTQFSPEDLDLDDLTIEMPDQDGLTPDMDDLGQLVDEVSSSGQTGTDPQGDDLALEDLDDLLRDPGPLPDLDSLVSQDLEDDPESTEDLDFIDDLELLLEEDATPGDQNLDDLSLLVESPPETDGPPAPGAGETLDDLSLLVDTPSPVQDLDDLSALVDTPPDQALDNLYDLVDTPITEPAADLDDLSALVEIPADLDDLSLLVETGGSFPGEPQELDDLSLLVDPPAGGPADLDDLSLLVDPGGDSAGGQLDNLSALISSDDAEMVPDQPREPSLKPDITPEQDMAKYKATVMKIIIDLKNKGLSPDETTERLNRDEVPTLSGKPLWREKAIAKIYGFIDSAQ